MKRAACLVGGILFISAVAATSWAQQSTTGPEPAPGIDMGLRAFKPLQQVIISGVPAYIWHHGCGPTAVGMVIGYWDGCGWPNLVPGDASTQTGAVDAMIADDSDAPSCGGPASDHFQDYSCPIDYYPNLLTDRSETGGAHTDNCVADYMRTSRSLDYNFYGWSWMSDVPGSFISYVNQVDPGSNPQAQNYYFSGSSWDVYKAEIDNGRPVVLLVDSDGNGATDHFVTGVGYDDYGMSYAIFNTWDLDIHWYPWRELNSGSVWGIYGFTTFSCSHCVCGMAGDVNGDDQVNPTDVVYIVNFVYLGRDGRVQPPNCPYEAGDVNCDNLVNPVDVVWYSNYVYRGLTPFPCDPCE